MKMIQGTRRWLLPVSLVSAGLLLLAMFWPGKLQQAAWAATPNARVSIHVSLQGDEGEAAVSAICVGETLKLKATVSELELEDGETVKITIYKNGKRIDSGSNPLVIGNYDPGDAGTYRFQASAVFSKEGEDDVTEWSASKYVTVVGVEKLQYKLSGSGESSEWTDIPDPLYVLKETKVSFRAVRTPEGDEWPTGKPKWSGTAGATGSGSTKDVTFSTRSEQPDDFKTVVVECGNTVTAKIVVVEANIKYPHGDPTVSATNWNDKNSDEANMGNERTFSGLSVDVECEAEIVPAAMDVAAIKDKIRWRITKVGPLEAEWDNHPVGDTKTGQGITAKATFTAPAAGLPESNDAFGKKTVTMSVEGSSGEMSTTVEIFYKRDATNHAGGQASSPNWFHYWRQTTANKGTMNFDPNLGCQTLWDHPDYTCYVDFDAGGIYTTPQFGANANIDLKGIDTFAWTARHEWRHHEQLEGWWGAGGWDDANDGDFDGIPDNIEAGIAAVDGGPFDNTKLDTFPNDGNLANDLERHCVFTQDVWTVGQANDEDWGAPGMQHKTNNKFDD